MSATLRPFRREDYAAARDLWLAVTEGGWASAQAIRRWRCARPRTQRRPCRSSRTVATSSWPRCCVATTGDAASSITSPSRPATGCRGLGRALVARCLDALAAAGIRRGQASVFASNALSRGRSGTSVGGDLRRDLVVFTIPACGGA